MVAGGGSHNPTLMQRLEELLPKEKVWRLDDWQGKKWISGDNKEAAAFAVLGLHSLLGVPCNVPSVTGAREEVVLGTVTISKHSKTRLL